MVFIGRDIRAEHCSSADRSNGGMRFTSAGIVLAEHGVSAAALVVMQFGAGRCLSADSTAARLPSDPQNRLLWRDDLDLAVITSHRPLGVARGWPDEPNRNISTQELAVLGFHLVVVAKNL
jgi:hypothetical protein